MTESDLVALVCASTLVVLRASLPDPPDEVDPDWSFTDLGLDSQGAVRLHGLLTAATGMELPITLVFDHPSPAEVAGFLAGASGASDARPTAPGTLPGTHEPIAIVGMACRFPGGVADPDDLWRLVLAGGDAITPFPDDRGWDLERLYDPDPDRAGTSYVRAGGFLADAADFDAGLFGISPREAIAMDPQQRLLLETTWEALERAGIVPESLRRTATGVFVGLEHQEYGPPLHAAPDGLDGHLLTGNAASVASGRIAYVLGLEGPALTVDTACSASLVALHLAVRSLRSGESSLALAGGAAVMATPGAFTSFSRQRGLAADARCKAFADAADGVGWSEGVGVLVLERLSDAEARGHPVLAVVRGTAVNSDGASNGLTAPNGPSQQRVIRAALADADVDAREVDLVEAHGTGTRLGDPIEVQALQATYGADRDPDRPLWIGSVKSNLGHTAAAAGVAGVIKAVQALRHATLPPTLHVGTPTSQVDWSAGTVRPVTEATPWTVPGPRRAGVSSFGMSGTNGHVVLEQYDPAPEPATPREPLPAVPWVLSAGDDAALRAQAARLLAACAGTAEQDPADVAYSLATTRAALPHRAAVVGTDRATLLGRLREVAAGTAPTARAARRGRLAMTFSGQGSQRAGMGRELYAAYPAFAEAWDAVCDRIDPLLGHPITDVLWAERAFTATEYVQCGLFVLEVATVRLLESWGVRPDAVIGHSVGELTAAHVAGVLSLDDACTLVHARGRLMAELPPGGSMAAVGASEERVRELLAGRDGRVGFAAVNGPDAVVLSGEADVLSAVAGDLVADGIPVTPLRVSHAFHSHLMDPMLAPYRAVLDTVELREPAIPIMSTVTGGPVTAAAVRTPEHWLRQVRDTVRYQDALRATDATWVLEVGPDAVLTPMTTLPDTPAVAALRRGRPEPDSLVSAVATLHTHGMPVDWAAVLPGSRRIDLPTYAFQRRRFWLPGTTPAATPAALGLDDVSHPLLAAATELPDGAGLVGTARVSPATLPWLADHVVGDAVLFPGTAFVELVSRAARLAGLGGVADLVLREPLVLTDRADVGLQVVVTGTEVTVRSRRDGSWRTHATGTCAATPGSAPPPPASWPPAGAEPVDLTALYESLGDRGLRYGPAFRGLRAAWRRGDEVFAEVAPATPLADADAYGLHPALFDGALHTTVVDGVPGPPRLPFAWRGVTVHRTGAAALRVRLTPVGADEVALAGWDEAERLVVSVESLVLRKMSQETIAAARPRGTLERVEWRPASSTGSLAEDASPRDLGTVLDTCGPLPPTVLVTVPPSTGWADPATAVPATVCRVLADLRRWLADERTAGSVLVVRTRGAVATAGEPVTDPAHAAVWGLVRSAQSEHPGRFVLSDADEHPAGLLPGEPQQAARGGRVLVPRITAHPSPAGATRWDPDRTVLVTGGTGGLGRVVARHLAEEHGVRHVMLASRSGAEVDLGVDARVTVVACDVTDRGQVAGLLAAIPAEHPLGAVVHAAGVVDDAVLTTMTDEQVTAVLAPKVAGAWHLHALTRDLDLDAFVLFGSVVATIGSAGQANYAAANAFLEALAVHRHVEGLPATAVAWGLWADEAGMAGRLTSAQRRRVDRAGIRPLSTPEALGLFDDALRAGSPSTIAAGWHRPALRALGAGIPTVLRDLVPAVTGQARSPGTELALLARLAAADADDKDRVLREAVRERVAAVLGHDSVREIGLDRPLRELGFDSLAAVDLRNQLNTGTGLTLPATLIFDHPTVRAIAVRIAEELAGQVAEPGPFAELTALEGRLRSTTPTPDQHARVTARLRALTAEWERAHRRDTAPGPDPSLAEASAEDLFDILDEELHSR